MSYLYRLLSTNTELAEKAIDYFTSQVTNPKLFGEAKKIAIDKANSNNKQKDIGLIEMGYLSTMDFLHYMTKTGQINGGTKTSLIQELIQSLKSHKIINTIPEGILNSFEIRYKAAGDYTKFLYKRGLILNVVCGWKYIIEKYSASVLKIVNISKDDIHSIGTGFYYAAGNNDFVKHLIITNKHVVEKSKKINVFDNENKPIEYSEIIVDPKRDLAFILLKKKLQTPIFYLNSSIEILSEILTIGYPSIPMTKEAYQVYHKGELNSFVEDYFKNELFLFSAKTSSGNSGSPIIDEFGMVIGIVTEELFEKDEFYAKGKLPYYAGIPTEEIRKSMNEIIF